MSEPGGAIIWSWISDAFGDSEPTEDPDGDGQTFTLNLRYPGQYRDSETGFYYNHFRYYDPNSGRYITSDPIGMEGGVNVYVYTDSNPLRFVDPNGLVKCFPGFGCMRGDIFSYEFRSMRETVSGFASIQGCTAVCTVKDSILGQILESLITSELNKTAMHAATEAKRRGIKTAVTLIKIGGLIGLAGTVAECQISCRDKVCQSPHL